MKETIIKLVERYLVALARVILAIYKPIIIGVTGSVGKTTTKESIAHLLKTAGLSTAKTEGNLNAELGIGLTILGYDHSPAVYEWPWALVTTTFSWFLMVAGLKRFPPYFIVELAVDRLGDMGRIVQLIRPTIGVITWIGEGHHLEYLKDAMTIAQEKGQILAVLPANGLAVLPANDPNIKVLRQLTTTPIREFQSIGVESNVEIVNIIGDYLKIKPVIRQKAIETFTSPKGRLNEVDGIGGIRILDDSYNMSLPAAREALRILANRPGKRKVAILGDMLEQGQYEQRYHEEVAKLAKAKADLFIGVGKRLKKVNTDQWFASPDEAAIAIPALLREGDIVLVKGSQGMRMEKISYALAANKAEATERLPRQNSRWRQIPFSNP